ncbi:MAG TPA: PAS-domain containing protein [Alphaproteobacteria bacterium]|nr:PAS-domain containing protein [Alphaproteobacteria bacterium]
MSELHHHHGPAKQGAGLNVIRALAVFVALLIVGAGAAFGLNAWQAYSNEIDRVTRDNVSSARTLEEQTARTVQSIDLVLSGLADYFRLRTDFERPGSMAIYELLRRRLAHAPDLTGIIIADRDGKLVYHTDRPDITPIDLSDRDYFLAQRDDPAGRLKFSKPFFGRLANRWFVGLSRRILDADGNFAGVVVGVVAPEHFSSRFEALRPPGGTIELFLHDGTYLARAPHAPALVGQSAEHADLFQEFVRESRQGIYETEDRDGSDHRIVAYRVFADQPLVITVSSSIDDVVNRWRSSLLQHGALALAIGVGFAIIAFILIRQVGRRIESEAAVAGLSREIAAKSEQLEAALSNMSQGLCVYDAHQRLVLFNRRYLELYGLPADRVVPGTALRELMEISLKRGNYTAEQGDRVIAERLAMAESREQRVLRQKLQSGRVIEVTHRPLPNGGSVATFTDITDQESVTAALRAAKEQAELANRTKSEFLANMSHELRTPLNAIIGFSQIMTQQMFGPLGSPRYREYAGDVLSSSQHLLQIINDILDMAKIEAGRVELHEAAIELEKLFDDCLRLVRERAATAEIRLQQDLPDGMPQLLADERLVKQILLNLLSNAVKFTPRAGTVTLRARIEANGACVLSVADTGIGIAPDDIPKVMQPFGQVDGTYARTHGGTGLGLSIVRALVELHGGTFGLESTVGKGTTASVRFGPTRTLAPRIKATG